MLCFKRPRWTIAPRRTGLHQPHLAKRSSRQLTHHHDTVHYPQAHACRV
nr:MAG TPA: hypothetical protein [Caudoviricetes sp.]